MRDLSPGQVRHMTQTISHRLKMIGQSMIWSYMRATIGCMAFSINSVLRGSKLMLLGRTERESLLKCPVNNATINYLLPVKLPVSFIFANRSACLLLLKCVQQFQH